MWIGTKAHLLERHDFYVAQIKTRVLSQFQDIEGEAERYREMEYERLAELPGDEDSDMSAIADTAEDRGQDFYGLLADLKKQTILGALAGMYHQWEKDLRLFIERELRHAYEWETVQKIAWDANIGDIFKILEDAGWNVVSLNFFSLIDACRLIVNVYKHGKGTSLTQLSERYPEYLDVPSPLSEFARRRLDHDWLSLTDVQFNQIADAMRTFWAAFPERLFLKTV